MENDYYLGLDIGTNSVGWAVTDKSYSILKFRGNAMWGIRLFEEAQTAETRRSFRQGRRRTQRRKERLLMLEMLFNEEISKVDPTFYQRLRESNLYSEDKSVDVPYAVFADENYNDKDYHRDYPTIYHLRYELINNEKPHDIRLVYLALHHIIKNRGHFLSDMRSDSDGINDFNYLFDDFADYANENVFFGDDCTKIYLSDEDKNKFSEIIKDRKLVKNAKKAETEKLFNINRKNDKQFHAMLCLLCGLTGNLSDVFADDSLKDNKISFSSGFEEHEDDYRSLLGEKFELLEKLKAVYDWALLEEILNGCDYLSEAKVKVYEKHKSDLKKLKAYVKKYFPEKYNDIFKKSNKGICNYAAYSAHVKTNNGNGVVEETANQEAFCSFLKKELGKECLSADKADKQMFAEIEDGIFMPKQRSASNGVIPMQLNEKELKAILDNAKEYLPFLISKDENGICVYEKIIKIFECRIPYYVGPLNTASPKSWLIRKPGKIYPWNIEEKVDFDKSAEAFINNLTSKCTYLPKFDVIPKNSLLYSKFTVLDELNNLRIDGEKISVELKQAIYNDCFMKYKKVSQKSLERYLQSRNIEYTTLSGFDNDFKSTLKPLTDLQEYNLLYTEKEQIIKAITIFGDDKKMLRKRLKKEFSSKLSEEEINKISKLKYSGWGRLSKEFLTEVCAVNRSSGEIVNIITAMWETNNNLIELLYSRDFCAKDDDKKAFVDIINGLNAFDGDDKSLENIVEEMYISPKVKRPVYQALLIADEIEKIMKRPPKKIFIEVAREHGEKKRTVSRQERLKELYKSCKKEYLSYYASLFPGEECDYDQLVDSLNEAKESQLRSDKLYFYYTQFGKCMYTGEKIDLAELMSSNGKWDIDHIYPQSKIKDDSLDNRVLVNKNYNAGKNNIYPISASVQNKMRPFWNMLLKKGMISKKKYDRLIRTTELSDNELSDFISRQLVETSQSAKAVANVLERLYPKPQTETVYVKAALVSEMRNKYDMLKCREVNDFHHAKDAYLNIVIGNVYNVKLTHNRANFIKNLQSNNKEYSVKMESVLKYDIPGAWVADETLKTVKSTMNKNNIRYTCYAFRQQGGFWKQQILKKGKGQAPLKQNSKRSDISKYGGYDKVSAAYFSLVEYINEKGKRIVRLVPVDAYRESKYRKNPEKYILENNKEVQAPIRVIYDCVKYGACVSLDGFRMHISSKSGGGRQIIYKPGVQLVLSYAFEKYIKGIEALLNKGMRQDLIRIYDINNDDNLLLYNCLIEKFSKTVYNKKFSNIAQIMADGQNKFVTLSLENQCIVINEILKIVHSDIRTGDLRLIGGSAKSGIISTSSDISNIKDVKSFKLINQSVTGLFENEVELLGN